MGASSREGAPRTPLHRDTARNSDFGITAVVQVIAVVDVSDVSCVHSCYPFPSSCRALALAQASSCRVHRVADRFAGYEKFHSPVLLPARGVIVGGHWQTVTEASD